MALAEQPVTGVGDSWYSGKPETLASVISRYERHLATGRFVDGCIVRAYHGQSLIPTGSSGSTSGIPRASLYLNGLEALTQENLVRSIIEAAGAQIVRTPMVKVMTAGASWKKQVSARKLSRLLSGVFHASGLEAARPEIWTDSATTMLAASKWIVEPDGKVICERALPHTLSWSLAEGPNPRTICQRHGVPRAALIKRHPDHAAAIAKLPAYRPDEAFMLDEWAQMAEADRVEVCEAWRYAVDGDPGRYVMVAGAIVLEDDKWDLPFWPIVPLTWSPSYSTFGGVPLARQLLAGQSTVNRMNRAIDEAQTKLCVPKILAPLGSVKAWTNSVEVIPYNPKFGKPEILVGQALPPEYYARVERVKAAMHELAGVSQTIAEAKKPAGVVSGRGQRDHYDIASGRLVLHAQRLERWDGQNARVALGMMAKAYGSKSVRLKAPSTRLLNEIDWEGMGDLREDEIEVRAFLTSAIPSTPSGRAETIAEWEEAGVINARRARRLYANPDTDAYEDLESSMEDLCMKQIESALDDARYIAPEPIQGPEGLAMLVELAGKALMQALVMKEPPPDENVELLRRLIEEARLLQGEPAPGAVEPAKAAPMAPAPIDPTTQALPADPAIQPQAPTGAMG